MTTPFRFEQDLPRLLEGAYLAGTPDYRDDLVQRIAATPQRPAWTFPGKWLPMDITVQAVPTPRTPWRTVGILAVIGLLIVASAVAIFVGSRPRLPDPYGIAANGVIAYHGTTADGTGGDIYIRDSLVAAPVAIISGPTDDHDPLFSRDGSRLFFVRRVEGIDYLMATNPDGTNVVQLSEMPFRPTELPDFSPDGREIALVNDEAGFPRLVIVATDGSGERRLDLPGLAPSLVLWRPPDGRELLVRAQDADGQEGLYLLGADGSDLRAIPAVTPGVFGGGEWDLTGATFSPDGQRIAYNVPTWLDDRGAAVFRVHVMDVDGSNDRELPAPIGTHQAHLDEGFDPLVHEGWPAFSPDGRSILTHRWTWSPPAPGGWVAVAPADLAGPGRDIGPRIAGEPDSGIVKAWSPDGEAVLIRANDLQVFSVDVSSGVGSALTWKAEYLPDWQRTARP